ncbi:MAG: hypothetical protein AMK73_01570 [Planctomycetes bacterium SM23_32]|nr:MAG: hypothetical protein AMK73_01570 [Planctomycetes bacterium SM23_32]
MSEGKPLRTLLVEDDDEDAAIFERCLSRTTSDTIALARACDGPEAMSRLAGEGFDLVFLDLNLRGHSRGMVVLEEICERGMDVPVVVVTGSGDEKRAVEAMKAGAYDYLVKDSLEPDVLERTIRHVRRRYMLERERSHMVHELEELSVTDELTCIANRRRFAQKLAEEVCRSGRTGHILALLMADLDHFKRVNDELGHQVGDDVLRRCAACLKGNLRTTDFVARYGGEEFCVLLLETSPEGARHAAERLRLAVAAEPDPMPTISIGLAVWEPGMEADELLSRADEAMYAAKQAGRNRVVLYGET